MAKPPIGAILKTRKCKTVKILREINSGGQGVVFEVDYDGQRKALKWYHDDAFDVYRKEEDGSRVLDSGATAEAVRLFYRNLDHNVENGPPSPAFLWPQDVTEQKNGSFGYIMDLRPDGYVELSQLLLATRYRFRSYQAKIDGMLNLANAFRIFHNKGYCYQDLNDGNFFFKPDTGELLICDNDNAAQADYKTGVVGKCRFMAPEVVLGQKMPDTMTDRFSMAVMMFFILFRSHPLEGASAMPACLTPSMEKEIYGSHPVFVFDPRDDSNRPLKQIANHSVLIWNRTPAYVQEAFERSFSREAMTYSESGGVGKYGASRLTEKEWVDTLTHFRNAIISCPHCGREEFFTGGRVCTKCGKPLPLTNGIQVAKYKIPVYPGARLYKIQLGPCADAEALTPVASVVTWKGQLGIRNISGETWDCVTSTGASRPLPPGGECPAKTGIRVKTACGSFEIV